MIKFNKANQETLFSIIFGFITVSVLIFSLLTINDIVLENGTAGKIYLFFVFLTLAISRTLMVVYSFFFGGKKKITIIKYISFATIYLITAILVLTLFNNNTLFYCLVSGFYLSTIIANRICLIFERKGRAQKIFNIILALFVVLLLTVIFITTDDTYGASYIALLLMIIIMVSFVEVLAFAFSKIKLKGLLKIIRTTYVFEILYGMVILIVSFSFYFMIMEDKIQTFGDGLWYSFAVVTTIGFGDYTVDSTISRILTVILGSYGIIVVASITSVIVNYYNEVKNEKNKEIEDKVDESEDDNEDTDKEE